MSLNQQQIQQYRQKYNLDIPSSASTASTAGSDRISRLKSIAAEAKDPRATLVKQNQPVSKPGFFSRAISAIGNTEKGFADSLAEPFTKVIGSGIRSVQATPNLLKGDFKGAEQKMETPFNGQKTLAASSPLENTGTALQIGSDLIGGAEGASAVGKVAKSVLTGGAVGATQGAGTYLADTEKPTVKGAATSAAIGGVAGGTFGGVLSGAPDYIAKTTAKRAAKASEEVDHLAGIITQGEKEKDIIAAKNALANIDVKGIKTYKDLKNIIDDKVEHLSSKLDDVLDTKSDTKSIGELEVHTKVGDQTVSHNYVNDALDQLENFYKKTNNVTNETRISQLKSKAESDGLTIKEVNNIAREHGKSLNGFNANGELASGLSKQAAENTRDGVKGTARGLFGDKVYNDTDAQIGNLIRTRKLVEDVIEKTTDLKNKIQERSLGAKVGNLIGKVINTLGLGSPKGIVEALIPRGQGFKVMNALDLEKILQKNLNKLQDLASSDLSESELVNRLEDIIKKGPQEYIPKEKPAEPINQVYKPADLTYNGPIDNNKLIKVNNYQRPSEPSYRTPTQIERAKTKLISKENAGKSIDMNKPKTDIRYEWLKEDKSPIKIPVNKRSVKAKHKLNIKGLIPSF